MSWFKRKPKNRRLSRGHVLSVKLRSSQVRAARVRLSAIALGVSFSTIFGLYLLWRTSEWTLNRLVYENNAFAIHEIDVQTDGVIARDPLRRWAGVKVGDNLVALDLARVKRDLELSSLIQSVAVERVLPHTLKLRVVEREPIAQVSVLRPDAKGGFEWAVLQLDAEGYVMLPLEQQQRATPTTQADESLPTLLGINPGELLPGKRVESPQVRAALQLIALFERSPMAGLVDLRQIDLSAPEILQVNTGQGCGVTFPTHDLDRQLRRWRVVYELGQSNNIAIANMDLSVANNIPVRWLAMSAMPPVTPKKTNPQRNRKKNV
jgi:cell division septal protein FtsQ